jgi:hypothetical protein
LNDVNLHDPKYRFEARVKRLVDKGLTREEAEQVVTTVITTKENPNAVVREEVG